MPTTLTGLLIFVALLTPGLLSYIQRRALADQPEVSALVELGTLTTISLATNLLALGIFAFLRWLLPTHTPDVSTLLRTGMAYVSPRAGYVILWGALLLTLSSAMAIIWARRPGLLKKVPNFLPALIDTSAWIYEFESAPKGTQVYVGCDLRDGSYIGGYLDWYNTSIDEVSDRDLALVAPIKIRRPDAEEEETEFGVVILSARDIASLYVSYLGTEIPEPTQPRGLRQRLAGRLRRIADRLAPSSANVTESP